MSKLFINTNTQITNTHRGGRKSKPFSPGTDFAGIIFTGELSGVDSAGVLRQGVFIEAVGNDIEELLEGKQALLRSNCSKAEKTTINQFSFSFEMI